MKILTLFILLSVLGSQVTVAQSAGATQDYLFKVLASSGSNSISKSANAVDWKTLRTGQKISKDDKIKLEPNSFLGLVHKSGRTLELKTAGTFSANELATKVTASQASFNQKYVDFMINEITKAEGEDVNKNRHSNMGIEGKVERAVTDIVALFPQEGTAAVLSDQLLLKWNKLANTKTYRINVTDMFDEVLYTTTVADTSYVLDLSQAKLSKENSYLIAISSVERPNATFSKYSVNKLSATDAGTLNKKLSAFQEGKEETSLSKLIQASFFEENKLYMDALRCYDEAIRLQPGVYEYKIAYNQFLARNNFNK